MSKPKIGYGSGSANDADAQFLANLRAQEPRRWAEYLRLGTREALDAWRLVRAQMRHVQGRREACQ